MNPTSGSLTDETREQITAAFARTGLEARIVAATGPEIQGAAEKAASAGDTLVAAGGDGTVSTVAAVAVTSRATLGVIPLRTLNHFARGAGIPAALHAPAATPPAA